MSTIETVLMSLLVLDAIALTVLVLLQQGKGADVGAAFGSGSSNTMFGSAGSTSVLTKLTAWLSIGFFAIAFGLAYLAKERADGAGQQGIPTTGSQAQTEELTGSSESVNSSDAPSVGIDESGADEVPGGDVPTLPED